MGVVTFDVPGVYHCNSSIGFQAQLEMVGSITVDALTRMTGPSNGTTTRLYRWLGSPSQR
jgi:hypothetical protein